ncbi:MAG: glycosyltransferase [Roseiflexaceae bacterium]|nr:glycosyltransferase [Roseiflexaceae bacterium]
MANNAAPLVSVLIPTYNRANYLPEALHSVLTQSFTDVEVIIVDDGSTDDTPALLTQITDPRVRCFSQTNAGTAAARNTALRAARGKYVACLDSDDRWDAEFLAITIPPLEANPHIGVVYVRCRSMDQDGGPLARMVGVPPLFPNDMLASLLYGDHLCAIGAVTRRMLLEQVGGWEQTLVNTEDWDLWLKLAPLTQFCFIDRVLASIRVHTGRATGQASPRLKRVLNDRERVLARAFARPGLTPKALAIRPIAYRNLYIDLGMRTVEAFGWRAALPYYVRAVTIAPNPIAALARLASQFIYRRLLSRSVWGVGLADWAARRKRRPQIG